MDSINNIVINFKTDLDNLLNFECNKFYFGNEIFFNLLTVVNNLNKNKNNIHYILSKIKKYDKLTIEEMYNQFDYLTKQNDKNTQLNNQLNNQLLNSLTKEEIKNQLYIKKSNLFIIILNSDKPEVKTFKKFIFNNVFNTLYKEYENIKNEEEIKYQQNKKINYLINEIDNNIKEIEKLKKINEYLIEENEKNNIYVNEQIKQTEKEINNYKDFIKNYIITTKTSIDKLNNDDLKKKFCIYKNQKNEIILIQSQDKIIKEIIKDLTYKNIILYPMNCPDDFDFLKEFIEITIKLNKNLFENIKNDLYISNPELTKENFYSTLTNIYNLKKGFEVIRNKIILNSSSTVDILDIVNYLIIKQTK